jgi:hypothetical protein
MLTFTHRRMLRHQTGDPIDEHAQFASEMAVRRKRHVQRHRLKVFETIWKIVPEYWGNAPHPTLTGVGVTWLYGFQFEIKVIARLPEAG